jgi:hypothetical protein
MKVTSAKYVEGDRYVITAARDSHPSPSMPENGLVSSLFCAMSLWAGTRNLFSYVWDVLISKPALERV